MVEFKLVENIKSLFFWRCVLAELLGDTLLLFFGCGSIVLGTTPSPVDSSADIMRIALTFGMTITCIVWALGPVSGAHLNPAVSLAFVCVGKISLVKALFYVVAQCAGATLGSVLLWACLPEVNRNMFYGTNLAHGVNAGQGVGVEFITTFMLVFVVCSCVDEGRQDRNKYLASIPLTIGLTVVILNLMGVSSILASFFFLNHCHSQQIPYSGASLNPARSIGPAIIQGVWENHWVYWVGPIAGGCVAAVVYHFMFSAALHPNPSRRGDNHVQSNADGRKLGATDSEEPVV